MRLVLATRNPHKLREFSRQLSEHEIVPLPGELELPPEVGSTYAENAIEKARAGAAGTGLPTIADDSGIEAHALGGAPGVRSARFAGPAASDQENLDKLRRSAAPGSLLTYVCVVAFVDPQSGSERLFEGRCGGRMADQPRGSGGFGYDPVFLPDDGPPGSTMAELPDERKDSISHRGRAIRRLADWLDRWTPER